MTDVNASPGQGPGEDEQEATGPVIRDKRRLDPETGQVREGTAPGPAREETTPEGEAPADGERTAYEQGDGGAEEAHPDTQLAADRLEDLRRLQAEYVNYKRRVDRDRVRDTEAAVGSVVEALLPVLDDIHSARAHGDLTDGPMAAIADKLTDVLGRFGVQEVGAVGEVFDPTVHEALMHLPEAELPEGATETTIVQVMQPGFLVGERLVRAARVAVADPAS